MVAFEQWAETRGCVLASLATQGATEFYITQLLGTRIRRVVFDSVE